MVIPETFVDIWGIRIAEPVTVLTDLLVSAVCFYAYWQLRKTKDASLVIKFFTYYFLTMSISTAFGGIIGHGFLYALSFEWKVPAWLISMLSVGLIERAAIFHAKPLLRTRAGSFFSVFNIIELIAMIVVVLYTLNFFYVETHAAYGLLVVVFSFELFIYRKKKSEESRLLLIAVGISAIAALVHLTEFTIHTWFNYNDLAHIFMALSAYVFYLGAEKIKLREAAS
jgi:hypothetical protein